MNTVVLEPTWGMRSQSRVSQAMEMRWFGHNRADLLQRIRTLNLDLHQQQQLIRVFARNGIIKPRALNRITSLSDLSETDLSLKVTDARISHALSQFNELNLLGGAALSVASVAPAHFMGIAGEDISNIIWGIRDSLMAVVDVYASQNNFLNRIFGTCNSHTRNRARNLQIIRLLYIASTNFAGIEDVQRLDEHWHSSDEGMPEAARAIWEGFLSTEGDFTSALEDATAQLARLTQEADFMDIPHHEAQLQDRLRTIVRELAKDYEAERGGREGPAELMARKRERAQCLRGLIAEFQSAMRTERGRLPLGMRDIYAAAGNLLDIIDASVGVLDTAERTDAREVAMGELMAATRSSVWEIKQLVNAPRVRHYRLQAAAVLALTVTTLYLTFRILSVTGLLRPLAGAAGLDVEHDPFSLENDSKILAWMLLSAEMFFDFLAAVYMGNMLQALRKTEGGDGAAHVPRLRKGLGKDITKRKRVAHMLVLVDEPIAMICSSVVSHVKSALWHGNADVLLADNSRYTFNRVGGEATIRMGRKIIIRHGILKNIISHIITPRLTREAGFISGTKDANLIAHYLAIHMSSEYTEADDEECQRFAFERTKEVLRRFGVRDKKVEVIGREIGRRVIERNKGIIKGSDQLLGSPFEVRSLTELLVSHGIALDKAVVMAELLNREINRVIRRSRIARICDFVLKGNTLSDETRNTLRRDLVAEGRLTQTEADQLIDQLTAYCHTINEAVSASVGEHVLVPAHNDTARRGFSLVYQAVEELMRQDKRINFIEEGVVDRVSQVVQKVVLLKHGTKISKLARLRKPWRTKVARCQDAALAIAARMTALPKLAEVRNGIMQTEETKGTPILFLEADARAWQLREQDIRTIISDVCKPGNEFGITAEAADGIAAEIIDAMRRNHETRMTTALEFAQQLVPMVKSAQTPEQIVTSIFSGGLTAHALPGKANSEKDVMIDILLEDLGVPKDDPLRSKAKGEKLKSVLKKFDPTVPEQFTELTKVLQRELGFSAETAHDFAGDYRERYQAIIGRLTEGVRTLKFCSGDLTPIQVTAGGNVRLDTDGAGNQNLSLGAITINLTAVKKEAEERVRKPNFSYPGWGAKGGTINCLLVGDCIPQNIGAMSRWITHRFINERFFQGQAPVTARQVGNLGEQRIRQLNELVARTCVREAPPELVAYVDRQITGNHKYLVPPVGDTRFTDPDFVLSYVISRLTSTRNFELGSTAGGEMDVANRITRELMDLWGFGRMNQPERIRYGVTPKTEEQVRERTLYLCGEVQLRLATAAAVNFLGNQQGCTLEQAQEAVRDIGRRGRLTDEQTRVVLEKTEEIITLRNRRLITVAGSGDQCFLQITKRAASNTTVNGVLLEHYQKTLDEYNAVAEGHGSSFRRERAATPALSRLQGMVFDPAAAAEVASVTAAVTSEQQFIAKALELHLGGKDRKEAVALLMQAMGVRIALDNPQVFAIRSATEEALDETMRKFGVFFEPLMKRCLDHFALHPTEDFSLLIAAALQNATFLTDAERTAFGAQAVSFVNMLQDIYVMEHEVEAVCTRTVQASTGRTRLIVSLNEGHATVSEFNTTADELEELQAFASVSVVTANAAQVAENIIVRGHIPLVSTNRESFGLELRTVGSLVDEEFRYIEAEVQAKAAELDARDIVRDEKVRLLNEFVVTKMAERLDPQKGRASIPCKQNYFAAQGADKGGGALPMEADCSTLKYAAVFVNDADYREPLETFTEAVAYTLEHPGYVHFGYRQFGRNYRKNATAAAFQSGGNAYWSWTNEANSLKGLTPSWGAQMCYSTRAYREGSHFIGVGYHKHVINNKFSFYAQWQKVQDTVWESIQRGSIAGAVAKRIAFVLPNAIGTTVTKVADLPLVYGLHRLRDLSHFLVESGRISVQPSRNRVLRKIGEMFLEKEIDRDQIINRKVQEMLAAQDATTESEDIATDIHFLRMAGFLMDETESPWKNPFKWLALQFVCEGTMHVPKEMFSSAWLPGIGGLGSHSEDNRGKAVTTDGRWPRGNIALLPKILSGRYGLWRSVCFAAMAGFWAKGMFSPFLQTSLLGYMFLGILPMVLSGAAPVMGTLFLFSFGTFGFNLGVFLAGMHAKGYLNSDDPNEGLACLYSDSTGKGRQWRSVKEGLFLGERPGFGVSPKEAETPAKAAMADLALDYSLTVLNALGMGGSAIVFATTSNPLVLPLVFWGGWNSFFGIGALYTMNKGAKLRKKYDAAQRGTPRLSLTEYLAKKAGDLLVPQLVQFKRKNADIRVPGLVYASEEGDWLPMAA